MFRRLFFIGALLYSTAVSAQLATFDAASAANIAKQIAATEELIGNATKQLEQIESVGGNLTGNLERAKQLSSRLSGLRRDFHKISRAVSKIELADGKIPDLSDLMDIRDTIDHIYDPTPAHRGRKKVMQYSHRQASMKSALEEAELSINNIEGRFSEIEALIKEVDSTDSLKDSQDMTNKLLLTLIGNQIEMKNLIAQFTRIQAVKEYEGIKTDDPYISQRETLSEQLKRGVLSGYGMKDAPCPDILAVRNQC